MNDQNSIAVFVAWKCPVCGCTRSGWAGDDNRKRFCMNWDRNGSRCGAILEEFFRGAA